MTAPPEPPDAAELAATTLERLLPRLTRRPDLPSLSAAMAPVRHSARDELSRVQSLVEAVATDPGLSARLLRLSNTAQFASADAGRNTSLQRAVDLLGFAAVQQLTLAMPMIDALPADPKSANGRLLREDFLRALLAAAVARELCHDARQLDATALTAMFQNIGRMLLAAHLPEDALAIRSQVPRDAGPLIARENEAALRHLGWRLDTLGGHVARLWGWPEPLRRALPHATAWPRQPPREASEQQRWTGQLANGLADLMLYADPATWPRACETLAAEAGAATQQDARSIQAALARARVHLEKLALLVGLPVSQLRNWQAADATAAAGPGGPAAAGPAGGPQATAKPGPAAQAASAAPLTGQDLLAERAAAFQLALHDPEEARRVPAQALKALWQGLSARRAMLWVAGSDGEAMQLHRALGQPLSAETLRLWRVNPTRGSDLFSRLCLHGHDSVIDDARRPDIAAHLPRAFVHGVGARCFLVLPLVSRQRTLGMLYLDRPDDDPFTLDGDQMGLVRTVRDQLALALAPKTGDAATIRTRSGLPDPR